MIPGLATSDTWDLDSHCHLALFPCISSKNPAPLWPGLISKYCMPPASFQSLPRAEWLSHLELCSISSCCTRSVWTSLRTVPHLEPYLYLRYPRASSQMARSTHVWAALVIQECRYVAPMGMTEWLQDDSHLSATLQPPHDKKLIFAFYSILHILFFLPCCPHGSFLLISACFLPRFSICRESQSVTSDLNNHETWPSFLFSFYLTYCFHCVSLFCGLHVGFMPFITNS